MKREPNFQFSLKGVPVTITFCEDETQELRRNIRNILTTAYKERMEKQSRVRDMDKQTPKSN